MLPGGFKKGSLEEGSRIREEARENGTLEDGRVKQATNRLRKRLGLVQKR